MTTKARTATALCHANHDTTGTIGMTLRAQGWGFRAVNACHEDLSAFDPLSSDLLIVMGGEPGVYQRDIFPFLKDELNILESRLAKDLPTIGICLGAQLMAGALGANVYKGKQGQEAGWKPVTVNAAGMQTPLALLDAANTEIFQWHGDTFDMPQGATLLASSAQYQHQVFSFGKNAIALQCHAEVTAPMLSSWFAGLASEIAAGEVDLQMLREGTAKNIKKLTAQTEKFVRAWLDERFKEGEVKRYA